MNGPFHIIEYSDNMIERVVNFNERLKAGGVSSRFPESHVSKWLPRIPGRKLYQEYFLVVTSDNVVHGAYILKQQDFYLNGHVISIGDYQLPLSEGVVNRLYPQVGVQLYMDALRRQPLLYGLGIGGYEEDIARFFKVAGWMMFTVPFYFYVPHPNAFLRNISFLRRSMTRRCILDIVALSGIGWITIRGFQAFFGHRPPYDPTVLITLVDCFSDWADGIWDNYKDQYGLLAIRNAETLNILYPISDQRFIRLKITKESKVIGWAVVLDSKLSGHKHFGDMRLGSIVDCFASVDDTAVVVDAARRFLESRGVDLIVSNQSHAAWQRGFREAGFLNGPSNFIFAASKKLTELLKKEGVENDDLHFNRGDGDGPIHL